MINPIYVGKDAVNELLEYSLTHKLERFALVADTHTYPALGQEVERALKSKGLEVTPVILEGNHIHTDEHQLVQTLIHAPLGDCTFLAVGAGTITDITRLVSHRTNRPFIAVPTAPSVDGFTSLGAPIILAGVKTTLLCQAPLALFADVHTLKNAPQRLVAAGFGDMLGKITSLADWTLGNLLWDEPYDASIAKRCQGAIASVMANAKAIGERTEEGVRALMDALIESGLCMLEFGTSRPASGAEHHASHYWEMKRLEGHLPTPLHGAQVGYALTLVAAQYARLRKLTAAEVLSRLEGATLPDRNAELANIRKGYGVMAEEVIKEHAPFLNLTAQGFAALKQKIVNHWTDIQEVASSVPDPEVIKGILEQVGAPATFEALGIAGNEVASGLEYGHYLRNRFTVTKLSRFLGLPLLDVSLLSTKDTIRS